jgi:hypothetical protein
MAVSACVYTCLASSALINAQSFTDIVSTGDQAPDGDGIFSSQEDSFGLPIVNNAGQVAFTGALFNSSGGSSTDSGIFRGNGQPGGLIQIARESDIAPLAGGGSAGNLTGLFSREITLNSAGQVSFFSSISG